MFDSTGQGIGLEAEEEFGLGSEELDDVAGPAVTPLLDCNHQVFLRLEQDVGSPFDRAINPQAFGVGAIELPQEVNDATPDVCGDELDIAKPALLDRIE